MSAPSWNDLLVDLRIAAPGANDPILLQKARFAWREFCREAEVYRVPQDVTLVAGQQDYPLTVPAATDTLKRLDGVRPIDPTTHQPGGCELDRSQYLYVTPRTDPNVAGPVLRLAVAAPAGVNQMLRVRCVLLPSAMDGTSYPLALQENVDGVLAKAKYELLIMPKRGWSNAKAAQFELLRYRAAKAQARKAALLDKWNWTGVRAL